MPEFQKEAKSSSMHNRIIILTAALLVACMTFIVYLPALQNDFVWDDHGYIRKNKIIQSIDFRFFQKVFTADVGANWHPLTLFSHALDYAVYGLDPWGHHLTNIIFHSLNTFLVTILVISLIKYSYTIQHTPYKNECLIDKKSIIAGIVTAFLFGIHPLHVESVAWVSERKDVLCAFFFLLTLLAYLKYTSSILKKKHIWYVTCLILFTLALMSKPMAVSLPVVLIILDFYPLRRKGERGKGGNGETGKSVFPFSISPFLLEKLPFFALSILSSFATIWAQRGALQALERYPFMTRILVAGRAFIFYLCKMILPTNLVPLYPYPKNVNIFAFEYIISIILLLIITFFCIKSVKTNRVFSSVWFYYVVTLMPVIGIVQVGVQAAADRYTYLPGLGPFLLVGLGVGNIFERYSKRQYQIIISVFITILVSGFLMGRTVKQISLWKNSVTLWSHEIKLYPYTIAIAYYNRGLAYNKRENYQQGITDLNMAVTIDPMYAEAYYSRATAYYNTGNYQQVIADLNIVIKLRPENANAYHNRGDAYNSLGDYRQAMPDFTRAIELSPEFAEAYYNRGISYHNSGNYELAIADYTRAIKLNPEYTDAYNNRGTAYGSAGNDKQSINDLNKAIELDPEYAKGYFNLSVIYSRLGNKEQAFKFRKKAAALGLRQ